MSKIRATVATAATALTTFVAVATVSGAAELANGAHVI